MELKHPVHGKVEHYHNHDIHQVVANEDSGKQFFGLLQQALHTAALGIVFYALDVFLRQREIGYLGTRIERREHET